MKLDNEFRVSVPIDRAWEVLTDIPLITPCLPGASLTGEDGDEYSGKVKIQVAPCVRSTRAPLCSWSAMA